MSEAGIEERGETIPTNLRLLLVLEEIAAWGEPVTPTDLNQKIGLPKPTIHRLFATLEAEGFLQREIDGRSYTPGRRLRQLSTGVLSSIRVRSARLSVMRALAEEVGETCNLAIPDREGMTYLDRVETKWPLRIQLPIGTQVPFYCTASGKLYLSSLRKTHLERILGSIPLKPHTAHTLTDKRALMAELEETRRRNFSRDAEEFMEGMIALAVPVLDTHKRLLATLSFHAPVQRMTLEGAVKHLPHLRGAASELELLVR
ncbi:MAG: IclR family transcriptional regulator [Kiloniellales bacterium]